MSALDIEKERVLRELLICCLSWEPQVCVLGNVRAGDAAKAIEAVLTAKRAAQPAVAGGDGLTDEQIMDLYSQIVAYPEHLTSGDYASAIKLARAIAAYVSGQGGNAEAWNDALEHAAYYVADHCVDGDDHAAALRSMKRKAVSGQGSPEEIDHGALYAVRIEDIYNGGPSYWMIGKPDGCGGWMTRDDCSWVGPERGVVEWHKLADPISSILGSMKRKAVSGQGGEDARKCATCQHWSRCDESEAGHGLGLGRCTAIPTFWNSTEWADDFDGRRFKAEFKDTKAFAQDCSDYYAFVLTKPDFGCASYCAAIAAKESDSGSG